MTNSARHNHHDTHIAQALTARGGHLTLGRGGFCLYFASGSTLSGYDCGPMKAACIAAGLPVIDSRHVDFAVVVRLAVHGPMVAVEGEPDPGPWHAFSSVPLEVVAEAYARAGAEVWNVPGIETVPAPTDREAVLRVRGRCSNSTPRCARSRAFTRDRTVRAAPAGR